MSVATKKSSFDISDLDLLEGKLGALLSPKEANPEFVDTLRHRLSEVPLRTLEIRKRYKAILIIATALFAGGLLVFVLSLLFGLSKKSDD